LCHGCPHYAPAGVRILIIKLDAIGDVARTTCLVPALRRKYQPSHITWLVAPAAAELLRPNSQIDVVLPYGPEALERVRTERFDLVLSLDKTARACSIAMHARAPVKYGFGWSEYGTPYPLNEEAEYAFALGISDELKFRQNQRTYQDVIFECVRLQYRGEPYAIEIPESARGYAEEFYGRQGLGAEDTLVGLNCGGGVAFANKMWDAKQCVEFIRLARARAGTRVAVFGAERERGTIERIRQAAGPSVIDTGLSNSLHQFSALLARCQVLVTADSLGMHLAIARGVPVVVLFGPTCAQEIELYGRGQKIVTPLACAPCYRPTCSQNPTCMDAISPESVLNAAAKWIT